jgi:hypothetical protein
MEDVKNTDIHPMLNGYDRYASIVDYTIGDDCGAIVMEWRPSHDAPAGLVPTKLFTIQWTDFVANDWCEVYDSLSEALGRLALLSACQEDGWEIGFRDDERWWGHRWSKFVREATS